MLPGVASTIIPIFKCPSSGAQNPVVDPILGTVVDDTVYFPDWAGNLYAVDKWTGRQKWATTIASATSASASPRRPPRG